MIFISNKNRLIKPHWLAIEFYVFQVVGSIPAPREKWVKEQGLPDGLTRKNRFGESGLDGLDLVRVVSGKGRGDDLGGDAERTEAVKDRTFESRHGRKPGIDVEGIGIGVQAVDRCLGLDFQVDLRLWQLT